MGRTPEIGATRGALHGTKESMNRLRSQSKPGRFPPGDFVGPEDFAQHFHLATENSNTAAANDMESAMRLLSSEKQNMLLNELFHGVMRKDDPDVKASDTLTILANLRPDQQQRIATAYRGTGHFPGDIANMVEERYREYLKQDPDQDATLYYRDKAIMADIEKVAAAPVLQKLSETCFHKVVEAFNNGTIISSSSPEQVAFVRDWIAKAKTGIFIVNHNWNAAFDKAKDFDGGEIAMPYELSVFEFRLTGHRICMCVLSPDNEPSYLATFMETSIGWACLAIYVLSDPTALWSEIETTTDSEVHKIVDVLRPQVRAMMIALEAGAAEAEVIRAPHKLNAARAKRGKLPIFDYHAVNLANRKRYSARLPEPGEVDHEVSRKRLHFVRGHWRHYENHKTKIKWHLRGDPDLGFIDKEYRL